MKNEHRFSFFIFQPAEKMNDSNIHALCTYSTIIFHVSANMRYIDRNTCNAISMIKITFFRTSPASYSNFGSSYCNQVNGLTNE